MEFHKLPVLGLSSSHDLLMVVAPMTLEDSPVTSTSLSEEKTRTCGGDSQLPLLTPESSSKFIGVLGGYRLAALASLWHR
jgi:hypothetical protein